MNSFRNIILLVVLLMGTITRAALATGTVWEVRSGGATTNGGGFNPTNANFMTDLAVTGSTGNSASVTVSSASYTFVAGDVNAWIYVKTGTGWTSNVFYKITAVNAGVATIDATIGHSIVMTGAAGGYSFAPSLTQGVGGASVTGATYGVDYSQSTSSILSASDLSCTTPSTTVTSAGAGFRKSMVGNVLKIASITGSGTLTHFFEIVSFTDTSNVVLDKTPAPSANGSAGNFKVGGSMSKLSDFSSATAGLGAVAGNMIFVTQAGGAVFTLTGSETLSYVGTITNPIQIQGYGTYRGDFYLGRNATDGKLITTNMPTYSYNTTFALIGSNCTFYRGMNFLSNGAGVNGQLMSNTTGSVVDRCVFTNPSTGASCKGIQVNLAMIIDSDVFMTGASGGATGAGIELSTTSGRAINCRVQMSSSSSAGPAVISSSGVNAIIGCTIIGNGAGSGIATTVTGGQIIADHCTITNFAKGFVAVTGHTSSQFHSFTNCLITDNTTYALDLTDAGSPTYNAYNRLVNPITINQGVNYTTIFGTGNQLGAGAAFADYKAQGSSDYRLATTSPAVANGSPASTSMGSRQPTSTSTSTVGQGAGVGGGGIVVR